MFDYDSLIRFIITEAFALLLLAFLFRKPLLAEICGLPKAKITSDEGKSVVMNSSYDGKFTDTQALYEVCAGAR